MPTENKCRSVGERRINPCTKRIPVWKARRSQSATPCEIHCKGETNQAREINSAHA